MVSPVISHNDNSNIATFIEVTNNKIQKISSHFLNLYGYKDYELLDKNINDFLKLPTSCFEKIGKSRVYLLKVNITTKWGIAKETMLLKVSIDTDLDFFIFEDNYNEGNFFYLQNFYIDRLTGLQNKYAFNIELNHEESFYATYVDIKNFVNISSFYGDDIAETILIDISKKLKQDFDINTIYKIETNIFCIMHREDDYSNIHEFVQSIEKKLKNIFTSVIDNHCPITLDYIIGVGYGNGKNIFKNACIALQHAKENDLKKHIYDKDLHVKKQAIFIEELDTLAKIHLAIEEDRIYPFYQPIYDNNEDKICKYECLARLKEANSDNFLSPGVFIDVAKKNNLNNEITKAIIRKSFLYFKDLKGIDFSINLSFQTLKDMDMYSFILNAVDNFPEPERIIFEVIESEAMPLELFENNILIQELRKRKCSFALDDFGSGYSNLSMLTYFNYNYLKIDGSLICSIDKEESYKTIKTIVKLAHYHGVKVVAEWVKSEKIQKIVQDLEIDYSQGYLFGKPEQNVLQDKLQNVE